MGTIVNRQKTGLLIFVILSAILGVFTASGHAQDEGTLVRFANEERGISFSYPGNFSVVPPPSPQVLLFLRPSEGRYPTFNVLMQVGNPKAEERTVTQLKSDVVDSYRAVGLYDAEVVQGEKRQIAGRTAFYARVAYKTKEEELVAGVYIVPVKEAYYVMTLVDSAQGYVESVAVLEALMKTVQLRDPPPVPTSGRDFTQLLLWFGGIVALLILVKVGHLVFKMAGK